MALDLQKGSQLDRKDIPSSDIWHQVAHLKSSLDPLDRFPHAHKKEIVELSEFEYEFVSQMSSQETVAVNQGITLVS